MHLPAAAAPLFWTHDSTHPQHAVRLSGHILLYHPDVRPGDDYESVCERATGRRCIHCRQPLTRRGCPVPVCVDWQHDPVKNNRVCLTAVRGWACHFPCALRAALSQTAQCSKAKHAMHQLVACLKTFPAACSMPGALDKESSQASAYHNVRTHVMEYSLSAQEVRQGDALPKPVPASVDGGPSPIFSPAPDRHALQPFGGPLKTNAADACFVQRQLDAPPLVRSVVGNQAPSLLHGSLPVHNQFTDKHECVLRHPNLASHEAFTPFRQEAWTGLCCLHCTQRIRDARCVWPAISGTSTPSHLPVESSLPFVFTATPGVLCSPSCHRAYVQQHASLATAPAAKTAMALYVHQTLGNNFAFEAAPAMCDLQTFGGTELSPTPVSHEAPKHTVFIATTCYHVLPAHVPPSIVHKMATQAMQSGSSAATPAPTRRAPKGTSIAEKQAARLTQAQQQAKTRVNRIPAMLQIPDSQ